MAVSFSTLTTGTAGATDTPSTASVSPGANKLIQVTVTLRSDVGIGSPPPNVALSGNGLTYVLVAEVIENARLVAVFRAMGASPSAGAIAMTFTGTGNALGWTWEVNEWSGINTSGTDGSGAVGGAGTNHTAAAGTLDVTIPGTPSAGDVTFAVLMTMDDAVSVAPEAGWVDVSHVTGSDTQHYSVYDVDQDQNASWTWTPTDREAATIGFIITAAAGGGSTRPMFRGS